MIRREEDGRNPGTHKRMPEGCQEFEKLLSVVVGAFNCATRGQFAAAMEENLGRVAHFLSFDRSTVFLFNGDRLVVSYHWAAREGGAPAEIGSCIENQLPWYADRMRRGSLLLLQRSVEDLPGEAVKEREFLLQSGVKSHLSIPLIAHGTSIGAAAFGSVRPRHRWAPGIVLRFRLIGEILTLALERHAGLSTKQVDDVPAPIVLQTDHEHLRGLALHLIEVAYHERTRTAERLHEDIMQSLAAAGLMLDAAESKGAHAGAKLSNANDLVHRAIRDLRTVVMNLQPLALQNLGFGAALRWLAGQMRELYGMEVALHLSSVEEELRPEMCFMLYDAARELLANAAVHGRAANARIELHRMAQSGCRMAVADNGAGFDTGQLENVPGRSFGIFEIREKTRLFGGVFRIASATGSGTRATISLPRCTRSPGEAPTIET